MTKGAKSECSSPGCWQQSPKNQDRKQKGILNLAIEKIEFYGVYSLDDFEWF